MNAIMFSFYWVPCWLLLSSWSFSPPQLVPSVAYNAGWVCHHHHPHNFCHHHHHHRHNNHHNYDDSISTTRIMEEGSPPAAAVETQSTATSPIGSNTGWQVRFNDQHGDGEDCGDDDHGVATSYLITSNNDWRLFNFVTCFNYQELGQQHSGWIALFGYPDLDDDDSDHHHDHHDHHHHHHHDNQEREQSLLMSPRLRDSCHSLGFSSVRSLSTDNISFSSFEVENQSTYT